MQYNTAASTHSVYLHWPFCPYRCHFCPFVALAGHDEFMEQYNQVLGHEIRQYVSSSPQQLNTLFLGGGTPSTWPDQMLLDTFGILNNVFSLNQRTEATIEVNPGTVRPGQLELWRSIGINRLSIGVQSLNTNVLHRLNRMQSSEHVYSLLEAAQHLFENVSVDLILGLPGVSDDEWRELIKKVVTWPIKHISIYFLTIHENTPIYFNIKRKKIILPHEDSIVDLYHWTVEYLAEYGLAQYELSNFARPGFECKHNQAYWNRVPYKGFGLGACSFDGVYRLQNEKNLMRYLKQVPLEQDITIFCEQPNADQIHLEKIMLGLRRRPGVTLAWLLDGLAEEKKVRFKKELGWLQEQKFIQEKGGVISLTPSGLVVENEIITRLTL